MDQNLERSSSTPFLHRNNQGRNRDKIKGTKSKFTSNFDVSEQNSPMDVEDQTMISVSDSQGIMIEQFAISTSTQFPMLTRESEGSVVSASSEGRIDTVFPAPGLILNELYQLYNSKSNLNKRNSAIIDYIRLIFQNIR